MSPSRLGEEGSRRGAALALGAALLFGLSTPVAKLLLSHLDPLLLAAVLYLGCGFGLAAFRLLRRLVMPLGAAEVLPTRADWPWLLGAIFSGGIAGPILLLSGLARIDAASASLLLNLEPVLTALIAWFVFRENIGSRIALGMVAIAGGATVLSWQGTGGAASVGWLGPLAVAGACLAWAVDNNLTRRVSLVDPVLIAMLKGLVAGTVNLVLALALGEPGRALEAGAGLVGGAILGGVLVGFVGYGASLVLFVLALRDIGAARTGAYFASAPFLGALLAVALGEPASGRLIFAGGMMLVGIWLHLTERHAHDHVHESLVHTHRHRHDIHHRHDHAAEDPPGEPHSHRHVHLALRHSHSHFPDAHHSHGH